MRDFAVTYPQLVRQAMAAGLDHQDLRELREVYDVALRQFDGLYGAGGQPFICHTVRTASILLAESQVGSEVEEIVWASREVPWDRIGAPELQLRELPRASATLRSALALRVAHDLENHMDLALAYRTGRQLKERIESDGTAIVQVATDLGMPTLAVELSMVFRESLQEMLPGTVRWDRSGAYELPVCTTSRTSNMTRFASRVRRALIGRLPPRLPSLRVGRSRSDRQRERKSRMPGEAVTRPPSRPRILVTGAAGQVAREIAPYLREHFSLRCLDIDRVQGEGDDEVVRADVRDLDALRRACHDVLAIVHLAGVDQKEPDFTTRMMPANVEGTYQIFEAARCTGIGRVIVASTGQVVGGYPAEQWLSTDAPVRPSSVYACTKVFGEALARY